MKEDRILHLLHTNELTSYRYLVTLVNLRKRKTMSVNDVRDVILVSTAQASSLVQSLVDRGLVTRKPSLADRRVCDIKLTQEGLDLLNKYDDCNTPAIA